MNCTTLPLIDGVRVVVPDSVHHITPYVLCEQQDWFEDEIRFLRRLLQPGQRVIDIGASYGVYALSMARAVGPRGHVWCFEPASATAALLAQGIAANGLTNVTLRQCALAQAAGTARLALQEYSELNAITRDDPGTGRGETVTLTTLDDCLDEYGWHDIAYLKIDAEGEEAGILQGGKRALKELSPLIQYEVKAGDALHLELIEDFARLGYRSYRLVPGLNLLVPFSAQAAPDSYLLNLFCCKPDRAAQLAAQGFLLENPPMARPGTPDDHHWRRTLAALPYGRRLAPLWEQTVAAGKSAEIEHALAHYCCSQDAAVPGTERFASLEASLQILQAACRADPSHLRLASLARAARAFGARDTAVEALTRLGDTIMRHRHADPAEPFLVPAARFEQIDPGEKIGNWVLAATLEEQETVSSFSSFFTGAAARPRLETIRELGYASPEMLRRLALLKRRYNLA